MDLFGWHTVHLYGLRRFQQKLKRISDMSARLEWSSLTVVEICSVIIQVINKIGQPWSGYPIFVNHMITDSIGRQEVLSPISHHHNDFNFWKGKYT